MATILSRGDERKVTGEFFEMKTAFSILNECIVHMTLTRYEDVDEFYESNSSLVLVRNLNVCPL